MAKTNNQEVKNGIDDCMSDSKTTVSNIQRATHHTKETLHSISTSETQRKTGENRED